MDKKVFVVLGDCNSIFVKQYIQFVLLGKYDVVLLQEGYLSEHYRRFYEEKGVHIEPMWNKANKWLKRIPKLRSSWGAKLWSKHIAKKYGNIAAAHVHGLSKNRCNMGLFLKPYSEQLILTVWGSDLLRRTAQQLKNYERFYAAADAITLATDKMLDAFKDAYGDKFDEKCHIIDFAMGILEIIDEERGRFSRDELCEKLGMKHPKKLNVYMGHNGRDCQRHVELTEAMSQLPQDTKDKINLVYTMTYGVPPVPYLDNLKVLAEKSGCEYTFIEGYRSEEEVAMIRLACDVLLHAQPTDAASASFFECMYAGAICVNGRWLPYEHIADYHNRVIEYDEVTQLSDVVQNIVENYDFYKKKFAYNIGFRNGSPTSQETAEKWYKIIDA